MDLFELQKDTVPHQVYFKKRPDGVFLIVENKKLHIVYLNAMAKAIYKKFNGKRTLGQLKDMLFKEYDISEKKLKNEILTLIRDMEKDEIVRIESKREAPYSSAN